MIGGSIDIVAAHGGDALAFGGDAITVAFAGWDEAMLAAGEVVALVAEASGTDSLAGPVELSVRVGVSGGEVTSLVCAAESRHVIVHLGDGLDRAVAAADRAAPGEVVVDSVALGPLVADQPAGDLPAWAARTLHPVTASRVAAGSPPPDEHRRITTVFLSIPATGIRGAGGVRGRRHRPGHTDGRRRAAVHGRRQGDPADRGVRRPRRPSR